MGSWACLSAQAALGLPQQEARAHVRCIETAGALRLKLHSGEKLNLLSGEKLKLHSGEKLKLYSGEKRCKVAKLQRCKVETEQLRKVETTLKLPARKVHKSIGCLPVGLAFSDAITSLQLFFSQL